ncbi:hypothetical protein QAD02_018724 [Eretmocerus hayati]|uniref:Uncharacterized protein n=1 Tax=Eretmocerus hayati TaxID=131215 RepID=A0ACC2PKJ9_9HYME|nr:hypothetical protein QAD02_018724 [Eretmocerus hayati]
MLNTSQGLATLMPTLQHLGPGIKLMNDGRQLIAVQSNGTVGGGNNGEARPVALVVHSSTSASNDNRLTFVHSANGDRPLTLAVQSSTGNEVRPVTFVSGNEARPIVLTATHAPSINVTSAPTRIRTGDTTQTTHKMVGGVTLVGGTGGAELARLPGGAELNILPANSIFRSVKAQPLTVQGGLTLSHAGVSLQATKSTSVPVSLSQTQQRHQSTTNGGHVSPSTGQSQQSQTDNLPANCHLVAQSGLTPIVAGPMTVVSQGGNGSQVILAPSSLAGKMIAGTPLLKSVGQSHLPIAAQYINNLVKPVVVVSSNHQQQSQTQQVTGNNGVVVSSQSTV